MCGEPSSRRGFLDDLRENPDFRSGFYGCRNSNARFTFVRLMIDPDDPRLQQECADRLLAYAAQLRSVLDVEGTDEPDDCPENPAHSVH